MAAANTNTSATGGYLTAAPPLPLDDQALDEVFQALGVAITGLDGTLVRPRWQVVVPKQPAPAVNWCAVSVMTVQPDDGPYLEYQPVTNVTTATDHETLTAIHTLTSEVHTINEQQSVILNLLAERMEHWRPPKR